MAYKFEIYLRRGEEIQNGQFAAQTVDAVGGRLQFREKRPNAGPCLTYEFDSLEDANLAANLLRTFDIHVEGPEQYGT